MSKTTQSIDLRSELTWSNAWRFPLQSEASRRDVVIGGCWLLLPVIGWLMNMGHRVRYVHRLQHGEDPWPAWQNPGELLFHGLVTFAGMVWYGAPGVALIAVGAWTESVPTGAVGLLLLALAVIAIPGYMSHYCRAFDLGEVFNPWRALSRVRQGGRAYWRAWGIVVPTMVASFVGLLVFGVGFAFSSVWFWQVAAFCFATVFTQHFELDRSAPENGAPATPGG